MVKTLNHAVSHSILDFWARVAVSIIGAVRLLQVGVRHPTFGGDCDVTRCLDEVFESMVVAALLWDDIGHPSSVAAVYSD